MAHRHQAVLFDLLSALLDSWSFRNDIAGNPLAGHVVGPTLHALADAGVPLGVVTNCSERLGRISADRLGIRFATVVTSERAGFYKPDPQPYLLALDELNVASEHCLFVAGSAFDLFGTAHIGLPAHWHNSIGLTAPRDAPLPLVREKTLEPLLPLVLTAEA